MADFQKEVIERSYDKPVLVDFWAPWCGPCRVLGPVLESLAEKQKDQWELVKVNTEEFPELADRYHIRSIPNVKLFYRGEVIQECAGALPQAVIVEWLNKTVPSAGLIALDKLLAVSDEPNPDDLEALLEAFPDTLEIRLVLSQIILWDQPARASQLLEPIKQGTPLYDKAQAIRDISNFLQINTSEREIVEAQLLLANGHLEQAIVAIIAILTRDNTAGDKLVSKAAIGIFNTLGAKHALSKTYRRQLDMVLWV